MSTVRSKLSSDVEKVVFCFHGNSPQTSVTILKAMMNW